MNQLLSADEQSIKLTPKPPRLYFEQLSPPRQCQTWSRPPPPTYACLKVFQFDIWKKNWKPRTTERSISDCHSHETVKLWGDGDFNVFILLLFLFNWLKLEVFFVFRLAFTFSAWGYCVQVGAYRGDLNIIPLVDHLQRRLPWGKEKFSFGIAQIGEGIF